MSPRTGAMSRARSSRCGVCFEHLPVFAQACDPHSHLHGCYLFGLHPGPIIAFIINQLATPHLGEASWSNLLHAVVEHPLVRAY